MCSTENNMAVIKTNVIENYKIAKDVYLLSFKSKEIAENALPGQFLNLKIPNNDALILRRPFSVYDVEGDIVKIIYMVVGKGTRSLSEVMSPTVLDVLGPLGRGFTLPEEKSACILVGGGCGTPPLYYLARKLAMAGHTIYPFLGYGERDKVFLDYEMSDIAGRVFISTDDASHEFNNVCTHHGTVMNFLEKYYSENKTDFPENTVIYSCGPKPLLSAVKDFAGKHNYNAELSLEEYMGCGFGVCLACAVKTADKDFKYVCKHGPVFNAEEVEI